MIKQLNIIVEGAQSTGKSTLITQLKSLYPQAQIISQVARTVISNQKITNYQLQNNINNCFYDLQYKIFIAQCSRQSQIKANNTICILDRCVISPLVYSFFYFDNKQQLIDKIQQNAEFQSRVAYYRDHAIVFLLCPQKSILVSDGVRKQCSFQQLQLITDIYRKVLKQYGIKYCEIKQLENRGEIIKTYLQKNCP